MSPKMLVYNLGSIFRLFKGDVRSQQLCELKVFIGFKLREVSTGNFHRKAPKWAKKRVKVSKIDQIRPPLHPTYCGNPPILSSELLWESIKFLRQPDVGIHSLEISASGLLWKCTNSVIGARFQVFKTSGHGVNKF